MLGWTGEEVFAAPQSSHLLYRCPSKPATLQPGIDDAEGEVRGTRVGRKRAQTVPKPASPGCAPEDV